MRPGPLVILGPRLSGKTSRLTELSVGTTGTIVCATMQEQQQLMRGLTSRVRVITADHARNGALAGVRGPVYINDIDRVVATLLRGPTAGCTVDSDNLQLPLTSLDLLRMSPSQLRAKPTRRRIVQFDDTER